MLKTVKHSGNKKTGPIAVTYRAGGHNVFATCPKTCALNPQGEHAADLIDLDYLQAVRQAVPRNGQAWTYSHFPAELAENFSCDQCGGGRPLCARGGRDYVVVFVAHGGGARLVGDDTPGGCYGNGGPVRLAWESTRKTGDASDGAAVVRFARSLPPGSLLRHHVVGDLGLAK